MKVTVYKLGDLFGYDTIVNGEWYASERPKWMDSSIPIFIDPNLSPGVIELRMPDGRVTSRVTDA